MMQMTLDHNDLLRSSQERRVSCLCERKHDLRRTQYELSMTCRQAGARLS